MRPPPMPQTPFEQQVQAVRRRMVGPQVRTLRHTAVWAAMDEDVCADCVLAAGGDAVVAHRLLLRWFTEHKDRPATPDMTVEDEQAIVKFIRQQAAGFDCDCGHVRPGAARRTHTAWEQAIMSSVYAVRRRLTTSLHREFIDTMVRREMPESVAVDALMLCNGDEQQVLAALDFIGVWNQVVIGTVDCTRLLNHLRKGGRQL